jgi:hypothetical protein
MAMADNRVTEVSVYRQRQNWLVGVLGENVYAYAFGRDEFKPEDGEVELFCVAYPRSGYRMVVAKAEPGDLKSDRDGECQVRLYRDSSVQKLEFYEFVDEVVSRWKGAWRKGTNKGYWTDHVAGLKDMCPSVKIKDATEDEGYKCVGVAEATTTCPECGRRSARIFERITVYSEQRRRNCYTGRLRVKCLKCKADAIVKMKYPGNLPIQIEEPGPFDEILDDWNTD